MAFGFDNIQEEKQVGSRKPFLREAGLHQNAKFIGLTYGATTDYEYFELEFETEDGKVFKERTFGINPKNIFVKKIWKDGKESGVETEAQAIERTEKEISTKLLYLAECFVDRQVAIKKVSGLKTMKELVDATNKLIGEPKETVNFLAVWKNNKNKEKSNLVIPERVKWCETYNEGVGPDIKLTPWQIANQMEEVYKYEAPNPNAPAVRNSGEFEEVSQGDETSDLPF